MLGGTVLGCVVAVLVISASVTPGLPAASGFLCRGSGGFRAHNVTFKEGLSLSTSSGGPDPSKECTFVAELLHSSRAGWAVVQHHDGGGRHYYLGNDEAGVPRNEKTMDALMGAAIRLFEEDLPATSTVVSFEPYSVRVELKEGLVEALRTYQAPHSPMWVRMQDRQGHVRELHFRPDSVSDLPVSEENHLMTLRELQTTSELAETVDHGVGLCRWAQQRSSSARRSKRQTEVVVINRRKKHHDGNGAAVAIGLGVGLGVGIPVVVLLALIPCVIALWLIMKRRRGSRTIRVADVPTGVFATGPPRDDTTRRQADVQEEEVEPDYQGSDLPYSLEDNY